MRFLTGFFIFLTLCAPLPTLCDPFDLMEEYEALLNKGDIVGAEKTALLAFNEARVTFPKDSPYIAKIGFDLAQFRIAQYKDGLALEPIEIAITNIETSKRAIEKADLAEFYLALGLAQFATANDKASLAKAAKTLDDIQNEISTINRSDDFAYRADTMLADYYYNGGDFEKSIKYSTKAIEQINAIFPKSSPVYRKAGFYAHFGRGRAYFIELIKKRSKRAIVLEGRWDDSYFAKALSDFTQASQIYGESNNVEDINQNDLMAWSYLLLAFGNSGESNLQFDDGSELAKAAKEVDEIIAKSPKKPAYCPKADMVNYDIIFPQSDAMNYQFGSAIAYYDIGADGKATNIRIVASLPNKSVGEEVKTALRLGKPMAISKSQPPECLKDIQVISGFVQLNEKGDRNDYWEPIRKSDNW